MQAFGSQGHIFKEQFTQQLLIISRCDGHLQMLWFWQHDVLCHKQITNTSVEMAGMQTASLWPSPLCHHLCSESYPKNPLEISEFFLHLWEVTCFDTRNRWLNPVTEGSHKVFLWWFWVWFEQPRLFLIYTEECEDDQLCQLLACC